MNVSIEETSTKPALRKLDTRSSAPIAVIDIGSNSVRLVVYEGASRNPIPIFNEKVLAGLGRNIVSTGRLDGEGVARAVAELERFRAICNGLSVGRIEAVATAAVREASNGPEFVKEASARCGVPIRVLSGKDEARLTAYGVLCGMPEAEGLVGDLGGGSLELVALKAGEVKEGVTLPIGALRLMDRAGGDIGKARREVDEAMSTVPWLDQFRGQRLYAVGGAWRSLAKIHMARTDYALRMLQHYEMSRGQAREIAGLIGSFGARSLENIAEVSRRRVETLPYGAVVLERLLSFAKVKKVVVSAHGLREGILYSALPPSLRRRDPLIEACHEMAARLSRDPEEGLEFVRWTQNIFDQTEEGETEGEARLREATCLLSGIGWRSHPDHRGLIAFREVMFASFGGVTHVERLFIGLGTYFRYEAGAKPALPGTGLQLNEHQLRRTAIVGAALRLGAKLAGGAIGTIPLCTLVPDGEHLVLSLPSGLSNLDGESVQKRLGALAQLMRLKPQLTVAC